MGWKVYGKEMLAGELTGSGVSQVVIPDIDTILIGVRLWLIFVGDPVLADLNLKIYGNDSIDDTASSLLHTSSDTRTKAEIITLANGVKEIYFTFNEVNLNQGDKYHFVLNGTGYVPVVGSSYVAWRVAWPDPVYRNNYTPTSVNLTTAPFFISSLIGADL